MSSFKAIFIFILISSSQLFISSVNCELAKEQIVGGEPTYDATFGYQVGIIGKHNKTYTRYLTCSGGILSDFFILGNAECFVDEADELKKLRYYVIWGTTNLKYHYKSAIDVLFIYTFTQNCVVNRHYVAVIELMHSLYLHINTHLKTLSLPRPNQEFMNATVSGFGFTSISQRKNNRITSRPRVSINNDQPLMQAQVMIDTVDNCLRAYSYVHSFREFCGLMEKLPEVPNRGLCTYDEGAPLVIQQPDGVSDIILGIALKNRRDCENTIFGNIYYNVSFYESFIRGVMEGHYIQGTQRHSNRIHVRET